MTRTKERSEFLTDVLVTAVEGGIGYWAEAKDYTLGSDRPGEGRDRYASAVVREMPSCRAAADTLPSCSSTARRIASSDCSCRLACGLAAGAVPHTSAASSSASDCRRIVARSSGARTARTQMWLPSSRAIRRR